MNSRIKIGSKYIFQNPYKRGNSVEWIQSGDEYYKRLIELIDAAETEIHIQTYIFASDSTGKKVAEALIRAAQRNVAIFIVVDAYGSNELSPALTMELKKARIQFRFYGRIFSRGRLHIGRRMHHKITVIDRQISIVGGINISDNYNNTDGSPAWLDFAVIMRGNICGRLRFVCLRRWKNRIRSIGERRHFLVGNKKLSLPGTTPVRTRINDFTRSKFEITISYREAIRRSQKSILLVGGYFLPGRRTRNLLKRAIERGVKISIIISEKSDVKLLVNARRYLYDWLLRNKIDVFEYQPANVHGKVLIADNKWTTIGSFDLNNLSTYSNIELNVDIDEAAFSERFAKHLESIKENHCTKIIAEKGQRKFNLLTRLNNWISYRLVKSLFMLSVVLSGKREKRK